MRVAIVAPAHVTVPSPHDDPTGNGIRTLADALTARGHTVLVCAAGPSHCDARVFITMPRPAHTRSKTNVESGVDIALTHVMRAAEAVQAFNPMVIHDYTGTLGLIAGIGDGKTPLVISVAEPLPSARLTLLEQLVGSRTAPTRCIAESEWIGEQLQPSLCRTVIAPGVTVHDVVFTARKRPYALYVGTADADSGLVHLARAARGLGLPLHIHLAGRAAADEAYLLNHLGTHIGDDLVVESANDAFSVRTLIAGAQMLLTTAGSLARYPQVAARAALSGTPTIQLTMHEHVTHQQSETAPRSVTRVITMADATRATANEIRGIDPYECRRIGVMQWGPDAAAASYEHVYRDVINRAEVGASAPLSAAAT